MTIIFKLTKFGLWQLGHCEQILTGIIKSPNRQSCRSTCFMLHSCCSKISKYSSTWQKMSVSKKFTASLNWHPR